jgi:uncharacterized membrane protein
MDETTTRDWRRQALLLGALLLASAVCVGLCAARVAYTGRSSYVFLVKNLLLAWIPLLCALGASAAVALRGRWSVLLLWAGAWLIFFPNAPYLMTDLVHLRNHGNPLWWYDVITLPFFAWTGLALGLASLYLMQRALGERWGDAVAWTLTVLALGLGAFGIQLGRFGRFNSWDVVTRPGRLAAEIAQTLLAPGESLRELAFSGAFALVLAAAYVVLLAFVRLGAPSRAQG